MSYTARAIPPEEPPEDEPPVIEQINTFPPPPEVSEAPALADPEATASELYVEE